jgi:hypothetical protein
MTLFVRFQGLTEATGTLRQLPAHLERTTINRMAQVAYDEAQKGAGRHTKPGGGALFQSLFNRPIPKGREVGHDLARAPHAVFVLLGTRPHEIRPKNDISPKNNRRKAALRWVSGNGFVHARVVKHPGYRGDGYLFNAATLAVREFSAILDKALKEAP